MDYRKLAELVDMAAARQVAANSAHIRLGSVQSVSQSTVEAVIDGSVAPAKIVKACSCSAGDRVVILKEGTLFIAVAKVGG